jgi:HTH-type transcriptional regulator/antitoxin HipB
MDILLEHLKQARKTQGRSQRLLAEALGIPQSHLSKIENGQVSPTLHSVRELSHTLGLELMLVPKAQISLVKALLNNRNLDEPAYRLDDEE